MTVAPLEVAPARFAGDVMSWSVVRVGAEALPKEAEAGTPHPPDVRAERLRKQRESSVARPPQRPPTALEPYWRQWVDEAGEAAQRRMLAAQAALGKVHAG